MAAIVTPVYITLNDYSNEKTKVRFYFPPVEDDGSNWGDLFVGVLSSLSVMQTALDAITLLDHWETIAEIIPEERTKSTPTDEHGQREFVIEWTYVEAITGRLGRFKTPGPIDGLTKPNSDEIDMTATEVAAFKVDFDAYCISRNGRALTLLKGRVTGRHT